MTELHDDDIRGMLEARAARAPDAELERLPRGSDRVGGRVAAGRLARTVPLAALAVIVIAVVAVSGIGRSARVPATGSEPGTSAVATNGAASSPVSGGWSYQQLSEALAAGRLQNDTVVLLRGAIERATCESTRLAVCLDVGVRGLDSVDISSALPLPFEQLLVESGSHASDALMALRVEGPRLRFLGWLDRDPADPVALDDLPTPPHSPATLVPVSGWLGGPAPPAFCPPMGPTDPNEESMCTGRPAVVATTADGAMDVPAPRDAVRVETTMRVDPDPAPGPVLLSRSGGSCIQMSADAWASCDGPRFQPWTARAALGAAPVIHVAAPTDVPAPTPAASIDGDGRMEPAAFQEALRSGALDGRIVEVTGEAVISMSICDAASGVDCRPVSSWGIAGLEDVRGSPLTILPCLAPCPDGAPTGGPFLFVVRGTALTYMGSLEGSLDTPGSAGDEGLVKALTRTDDPHVVRPVEGWFVPSELRLYARRPGSHGLTADSPWWLALAPDAVAIDQAKVSVAGPFLVGAASRSTPECSPASADCSFALVPIVLGRYDQSRVVRVALE